MSGDKREVDRLFMDILRANQNGNIVVVSFFHAESDPKLNEEARQLGLEPRYVYRVTQVADLGQGRQIVRVKNCSGQWIVSKSMSIYTHTILHQMAQN